MKILHTADWHLGKKLDHFSRLEEQKIVMNEICIIAEREQVEVVIVAGDLFDTFNPSADAQDLFYKTLHRLSNSGKTAVIAIAGNHDMPERIEAPNSLAELNGIILCGFPGTEIKCFKTEGGIEVLNSEAGFIELKVPENSDHLRILFTPYANELRLKSYLGSEDKEASLRNILEDFWKNLADKYCDKNGINILTAHLYFMKKGGVKEEESEGERSILHIGGAQPIYSENIPSQIQYVALGHLHRYHAIDKKPCPIVYSSSPLCYSFAETDQIKQVVIIDAVPGKEVVYRPVALESGKKLIRVEFGSVEEAQEWLKLNQEYYVEVTIRTATFLDGAARKQLADVHNYIVDVIPKITITGDENENVNPYSIDDTRDMKALFVEYFKFSKKNEEPSDNIIELLNEVLSQNEEK
jgi:exonuclease SbcD